MKFEIPELKIQFTIRYLKNNPSSLYFMQKENVLITSTNLIQKVPKFLFKLQTGWARVEYQMLPSSNFHTRITRERLIIKRRTIEIERILSRIIRRTFNYNVLNKSTLVIDNDILIADGSTRSAALNSSLISLILFLKYLKKIELLKNLFFGISFGINQDNNIIINPNFKEDYQLKSDIFLIINQKQEVLELHINADKGSIKKEIITTLITKTIYLSNFFFKTLTKIINLK